MPGFQRVNPLGDGFIRGPARVLVAPTTTPFPAKMGEVINLATTGYTTEVQSLVITGTPTGGTFTLGFMSQATAPISYRARAEEVQAALVALPGIGAGGVRCEGGPLPTAIVITFAGANRESAQPLITTNSASLTGGTTPAAVVTRTTAGFGVYDPVGTWTELGSTKQGVQIGRNNTETQLTVDQVLGNIATLPDEWEKTVQTNLAEVTLENLQLAWEGGAITTDATQTPTERHLPMGAPLSYTQKRLAVVHQKTLGTSAGKLRMHVMRLVQRSPQNSQTTYQSTGDQQTLPHVFRALADPSVSDPLARFGEIIDQNPF